jgi:hypothetical protein
LAARRASAASSAKSRGRSSRRCAAGLDERNAITPADIFGRPASRFAGAADRPFDHAAVDEAQDLGVAEARFLGAPAGGRPDGLFFTGDLGQRIFQQPFSWKSLGIDVRGRSFTLRVNHRASQQIRSHADRLLPQSVSDVDGNAESRRGTVSVFSGPAPDVPVFATREAERAAVAAWIGERLREGCRPHELAVFVRSPAQLTRAEAALGPAQARSVVVTEEIEAEAGSIALCTMHLAKPLGQCQRLPRQAEKQPAGIRGHRPAIEGGFHPAAGKSFKVKAIRVTLAGLRGISGLQFRYLVQERFRRFSMHITSVRNPGWRRSLRQPRLAQAFAQMPGVGVELERLPGHELGDRKIGCDA